MRVKGYMVNMRYHEAGGMLEKSMIAAIFVVCIINVMLFFENQCK